MKFQCGDFFVLRGFGLISRGIRFLSSIRYGIPFKETFSHVESAITDTKNISAEANGIRKVLNTRTKVTDAYVKVYRLKKFNKNDKDNHEKEAEKHEGKRYAIWRYLLDTTRILSSVIIIFGWILALINIWVGFFLVAVFCILTFSPLKDFLKKKDQLTEDCTETQSLIYSANKKWFPLPKPRNEFPNGMVQVWENLVLNGVAIVVAEKQRGGKWEWKIKEETPVKKKGKDSI